MSKRGPYWDRALANDNERPVHDCDGGGGLLKSLRLICQCLYVANDLTRGESAKNSMVANC